MRTKPAKLLKGVSMKRIASLAFYCLLVTGLYADARGDEIAKSYIEMKAPTDTSATMVMTITDRGGVVKTRKLKMVTKETPKGTKAVMEFIEPADVRGMRFLTISSQGATPIKGSTCPP